MSLFTGGCHQCDWRGLGTPVLYHCGSLVDPGSSATIMSFELFKQIRPKAGITAEDPHLPDMVLAITVEAE